MKKLFIGLGAFFLIAAVAISVIFLIMHSSSKNKDLLEPTAPNAPNYSGGTSGWIQAEDEKKKATYERDMEVYKQNMAVYQEQVKSSNDQANNYLVYMVILDSVLLVLAFVSFLVAFLFIQEKKEVALGTKDTS